MFKKGDKVLLNEKGIEAKYKGIYKKWNGKPLTIESVRKSGLFYIRTIEIVDGNSVWKAEELIHEKEENEI